MKCLISDGMSFNLSCPGFQAIDDTSDYGSKDSSATETTVNNYSPFLVLYELE